MCEIKKENIRCPFCPLSNLQSQESCAFCPYTACELHPSHWNYVLDWIDQRKKQKS